MTWQGVWVQVMVSVVDATSNESFNSHLAVGLRGGQILTAAPSQHSTLLAIEQELGSDGFFAAAVDPVH